jgi:hypothetical protein
VRVHVIATVAALAFAACSGGENGTNCQTVQPCGGDLIGSWRSTASCPVASAAADTLRRDLNCADAQLLQISESEPTTITFGDDLTYSGDSPIEDVSITASIPASCVGGTNCADVTRELANHYDSSDCSGGSTCTCKIPWLGSSLNGFGTYTTSGSTLTLTPDWAFITRQYCVTGPRLDLFALDTTGAIFDRITFVAQ